MVWNIATRGGLSVVNFWCILCVKQVFSHFSEATGFSAKLIPGLSFSKKMGKMKIHGKGGLLDFSKDKLTERNKENSFLDVDWIITGNFFILYTLVQVNCNNLRNK